MRQPKTTLALTLLETGVSKKCLVAILNLDQNRGSQENNNKKHKTPKKQKPNNEKQIGFETGEI